MGLAAVGLFVLALCAGGGGAAGPPAEAPGAVTLARGDHAQGAASVPGEVIVRFKAGTTPAERRDAVQEQDATVEEALALPRAQLVELPEEIPVEEAVAAFEADPDVAYAEPNFVYEAAAIPNDTEYGSLWALPKISAPQAWDLTTGSTGVVVAVVDTGVAYNHPDLAPNIWTNPGETAGNGVDDDGNGKVDDVHGWDFVANDNAPYDAFKHGTHVAGTIGARGNNALGVTGVSWQVSLMPVRAGDAGGSFPLSKIVNAFGYACANGARVVNGSFGGFGTSQAMSDAIGATACANTLFVFAAGNDGTNNDTAPQYPCNYPFTRIVCVAATDAADARASFSNYGVSSVDLAAPGVTIRSTVPTFTTVLVDSFENVPTDFTSRWGAQSAPPGHPLWGQESPGLSGAALSDSPGGNYFANTDSTIRSLVPLSLSGFAGCSIDYALRLETQTFFDFFRIEAATSTAGPWTDVTRAGWTGSSGGLYAQVRDDLGVVDGQGSVYLRFRLTSAGIFPPLDGAHVDDLVLSCATTPPPSGEYGNISGTSMAAPHVAGTAALMLERNPALTPEEVRTLLMSTVDPVAGLQVGSGGRLNAEHAVQAAIAAGVPPSPPAIVSGPSGFVGSADATFSFTVDPGSTAACSLDGADYADCTTATTQVYAGLSEGEHTFRVRATNFAGSAVTTRVWTVDTIPPPDPTIDSGPSGFVASTDAAFGLSDAEAGVAFDCSLDGAGFTSCSSPKSYSTLAQGEHTFQVSARDAAGNVSGVASRTWTVDTVAPPAPTIDSGPSGLVSSLEATFTFSDAEGDVSFECSLDSADFTACASPAAYTGLDQGLRSVRVRALDAAGNVSTEASRAWTVDTVTPPAPSIDSGPSGSVSSTSATFAFTDSEGGVTFECSLDGADYAGCSSPAQYTGLADGSHTFAVRAKDAAGNPSAGASRTWTVDTTMPTDPSIDEGPAAVSAVASATFEFSDADAGVTFECSLDDDPFATCTPPKTYAGLDEGGHTFTLRARNAAGTASNPVSFAWIVDTIAPPVPTIDTGPFGLVSSSSAAFEFSDAEAGVAFECSLDGAPLASCASPTQYTGLGQGGHSFEVRAKDAAGNTSATRGRLWEVDTVAPPTPSIDSGPSGFLASTASSFTFSDPEAGATFECRLGGDAFAPCASPTQLTGLGQGAHTFEVRAKDTAGNVSGAASRTWTVDTVAPPEPTIDSGPSGLVSSTAASFGFSDTEPGVTLECSLDGGVFAACSPPHVYTGLGQGAHTFEVRAKDAAANPSSTASRSWTVDTIAPPAPTIDSGPSGLVSSTAASFGFSDTEPGVTLECSLDGGVFAACSPPHVYTGLGQGAHTFEVRAKDAAGNPSPAASRAWTVDTLKPNTMLLAAPSPVVTKKTATFRFKASEKRARFQCKLDRRAWTACRSPRTYRRLKKGTHTFQVRTIDAAGNVDATPAKKTWRVR
jgi:subtilisin family serine protease